MRNYLKSGRQAIQWLYFLIIGLAVTEAIKTLFIKNQVFELPSLTTLFLFLIFFSFVTRFFMGAYRVIAYDIEVELRRPKIVIDSIGFFLQALAFYIYAISYQNFASTQWMIIIICVIDLVWLVLLAAFWHIMDETFGQWSIHNIIMTGFVLGNIFWWQSVEALLVIAWVAFIVDFGYNREFYFALKKSIGLRIFVAGPYGDNEPEEVIAANVERAKQVGKELALKGHYPFIPHTMLHGWEQDDRFKIEDFKRIDYKWLEFCDALFFIAESKGANEEKNEATKKGLQIFSDLSKVPIANK